MEKHCLLGSFPFRVCVLNLFMSPATVGWTFPLSTSIKTATQIYTQADLMEAFPPNEAPCPRSVELTTKLTTTEAYSGLQIPKQDLVLSHLNGHFFVPFSSTAATLVNSRLKSSLIIFSKKLNVKINSSHGAPDSS